MNKNLKKVISAIAALAVSASSIVAFAAGYPDVPETASYKQAVTELTALGIVEGTDNGTFEPDQNVTRAQIAKMIVAAKGSSDLSAAEAQKGQNTKFDDVTGSHWAAGYISVATAKGTKFVDGYSDTEFGPEDNVTFAQATKMIVSALGYEQYAENEGGWPGGYLNYGYTLGIADGVSASNDTELTRAQVAQMIDNALKAPICVIDSWKTEWNGEQTPVRVKKDTPNQWVKDQWVSLLNSSHKAYVFNGRVRETHQSNPSLDIDKVKVSVEKADNFEGYQVVKGESQTVTAGSTQLAYIGDSTADKDLLTYSEILVQKNDDDEYTILSISPIGANKIATFATEDYAKATTDVLYSYVDESSVKTDSYKVDTAKITEVDGTKGGFYVNGKKVNVTASGVGTTLADRLTTYVNGNTTGTVTLIDSPDTGSTATDGVYDYIMVTYYKDAVVASVVGDEEECTIRFDSRDMAVDNSLDVDLTDENMYYSFKTVDGEDVAPIELNENDVLSIAWDVEAGFSGSKSYDVIVSTATAEGKLTGIKKDKYTVGNEAYKLAGAWVGSLTQGYEYTLYLDAFGKVAAFEETAASKKYAVLDSVYNKGGDNYYATIITTEGVKEEYPVAKGNYATYAGYVYSSGTEKKFVQDRVIVYSVTSAGNLNIKSVDSSYKAANDPYKESTQKIGSIKLSDTLTSALYLGSEYASDGKVATMAVDAFEDAATYTAYGYNKLSDGSYQFVIVTAGNESISYKTDFVVFSSAYSTSNEDGDVYAVLVANGEGELTEVLLEEDYKVNGSVDDANATSLNAIAEGTPLMLAKNTSGYVTDIYTLFTADLSNGYDVFADAARDAIDTANYSAILNVTNLNKYLSSTAGSSAITTAPDPVDWVFGAVYDTTKSSITLAKAFVNTGDLSGKWDSLITSKPYTTDVTNTAYVDEYDLDVDAKVIVYDYKKKEANDLRVYNDVITSALKALTVKTDYLDADKDTLLDWKAGSFDEANETDTYGRTAFALLKLVDGDVVEAFVINPSTSKR